MNFEKGWRENGKGGQVCVKVFVVNLATFFRAIGFSTMKGPFERWMPFVGYFVSSSKPLNKLMEGPNIFLLLNSNFGHWIPPSIGI